MHYAKYESLNLISLAPLGSFNEMFYPHRLEIEITETKHTKCCLVLPVLFLFLTPSFRSNPLQYGMQALMESQYNLI
jgi:hypothetical protein